MTDSLETIAKRLQSSKFTGHSYMPIYDDLFSHLRNEPIQILELGVGDGNSMHLWLQGFANAIIHGIDASKFETFTHPRMLTYACDVSTPRLGLMFPKNQFDIIFDDASHKTTDQRVAWMSLWPTLKPGGYYCIEDIYMTPENGGVDEAVRWWIDKPGFRVFANFKTGFGDFRNDDVLIILRKP